MNLQECIQKIEKYLQSNDYTPRLVNVNSHENLQSIKEHFSVGNVIFLPVTGYSGKNKEPQLDVLQNKLLLAKENLFLTGFTSYAKLLGSNILERELKSFITQTFSSHIVILCFQCADYLNFSDSRAERLVYLVDDEGTTLPKIVFVSPELETFGEGDVFDGLSSIFDAVEHSEISTLYVKTQRKKEDFPYSLYFLESKSDIFDVLISLDPSTCSLEKEMGTVEEWGYAFEQIQKHHSWHNWLEGEFHLLSNLGIYVVRWNEFGKMERWAYFIALKLYGVSGNLLFQKAIGSSTSVTMLVREIYRSILDLEPNQEHFWEYYQQRKKLLADLNESEEEMIDYLQLLKIKGSNAIYYLTDSTQLEREELFRLFAEYHEEYPKNKLLEILEKVYPDLASYLSPYHLEREELGEYFEEYKYQKVINHIYPEFIEKVQEYGKSRNYNLWLPTRTQVVDSLSRDGMLLYFVDALGVEYLNFIRSECQNLQLMANISLCRCELPSITSMNKEFLESFTNIAPKVESLDEVKHHPVESLNYHNTKLPVHLIKELEIIRNVLKNIRTKLVSGEVEKACIISDHGASRLAVIQEQDNQWQMASKGIHSGRCCPVSEADVQSEYATESNGFWSLANYDRFKGGRKANVEVHGGATLEEVVVPVIEFTYLTGDMEVMIQSELPLEVSFRKKAEILLFSKTYLSKLTVCINGKGIENKYYDAVAQDRNVHLVAMPEVKQAGEYAMSVFYNNNLISELSFTVKKEGSSQRDIL